MNGTLGSDYVRAAAKHVRALDGGWYASDVDPELRAMDAHNDASECLTEEVVVAFVSGRAPQDSEARVKKHVDACGDCRRIVAHMVRALGESTASEEDEDGDETLGPHVGIGDIIAEKYRVERIIGVGGMGKVVAAEHLDLRTTVALKFLRNDSFRNPDAVRRFAREARAAATLRSAHVARIFDVGTLPSGLPYMVMEYLEGGDLGWHLDRNGPPSVEQGIEYILQACAGIEEAHAAGIVHRDLKLANLFVTTASGGEPLVKVLDFGLAKNVAELSGMARKRSFRMTRTETLLGSPHYISPEQLQSAHDVDGRTDIWALGVCMYELFSGTVPFNAPSFALLSARILMEEPRPLREAAPSLPVPLLRIVHKCLRKAPSARYQTIAELVADLVAFRDGHAADEPPPTTERLPTSASVPQTVRLAAPSTAVPQTVRLAELPSRSDARSRTLLVIGGVTLAATGLIATIALFAVGGGTAPAAPARAQTSEAPPALEGPIRAATTTDPSPPAAPLPPPPTPEPPIAAAAQVPPAVTATPAGAPIRRRVATPQRDAGAQPQANPYGHL
jgi:eukaryotic-like serine/threonine-protein kinase